MGRVWFSSAKPIASVSSTMPPAAENGYRPKTSSSKSMISACRASDASMLTPSGGGVSAAADDPVVRVRRAAGRGAGNRPPVERVAVVLERRRPGAGRDDDVVDERAGELEDLVARVADRHLDRLARVGAEVDPPLLVAVARPLARPPHAGAARRRACAVAVVGLVVLEERVQLEPGGTREARVLAGVPVQVGERRPVVGPTVCASTKT